MVRHLDTVLRAGLAYHATAAPIGTEAPSSRKRRFVGSVTRSLPDETVNGILVQTKLIRRGNAHELYVQTENGTVALRAQERSYDMDRMMDAAGAVTSGEITCDAYLLYDKTYAVPSAVLCAMLTHAVSKGYLTDRSFVATDFRPYDPRPAGFNTFYGYHNMENPTLFLWGGKVGQILAAACA